MIILYSTGCVKCRVLKEKLDDKKIEYVEITDKEIMLKEGLDKVPVLEVNGEKMSFSAANQWIMNRSN